MAKLIVFLCLINNIFCFHQDELKLAVDYILHKDLRCVCYLSCENQYQNYLVAQKFREHNLRISVQHVSRSVHFDLKRFLYQWDFSIGVILDGSCYNADNILGMASNEKLFDENHYWLILSSTVQGVNDTVTYIDETFQGLNLSVDANIIVVTNRGDEYQLTDVFNFGKIQGNELETRQYGTWQPDTGLEVKLQGYKYYSRWNFHNVTFRTISVILGDTKQFFPEMLTETKYTAGVAAMTKISSQLLYILKEHHNFRFNYTIGARWIGSVDRNSTLTVSKALYWEEQDLSSTCGRAFPQWLDWFHLLYPPATYLQTKFYYLIPADGVGAYENRFLMPMSPGVWYCALASAIICIIVLGAAAALERRPEPGLFAFFSVTAAMCQQAYEDGVQILGEAFSSQGRRLTLLVIGLTSMLLYNYYTSSVVSWLLNAAVSSIASLDELMNSDFELVFEDIGYTRGWLFNAGLYYYSGFKNPKEDELRDKKVTNAKRTVPVLTKVETGIELMRTGKYAFHTEPYTASQVIGKTFGDEELCNLGGLQMMPKAPVYMWVQKRSPYKEFFVWSLMRLLERGHTKASRARFAGTMPACSGRRPRALALGQAAPAFLLLFEIALLSLLILSLEIFWQRIQLKSVIRKRAMEKLPSLVIGGNHST